MQRCLLASPSHTRPLLRTSPPSIRCRSLRAAPFRIQIPQLKNVRLIILNRHSPSSSLWSLVCASTRTCTHIHAHAHPRTHACKHTHKKHAAGHTSACTHIHAQLHADTNPSYRLDDSSSIASSLRGSHVSPVPPPTAAAAASVPAPAPAPAASAQSAHEPIDTGLFRYKRAHTHNHAHPH